MMTRSVEPPAFGAVRAKSCGEDKGAGPSDTNIEAHARLLYARVRSIEERWRIRLAQALDSADGERSFFRRVRVPEFPICFAGHARRSSNPDFESR